MPGRISSMILSPSTEGSLSKVDKIIIFTLFFYFLAYPFIIRNVMGVIYPLMLNGLLLVTFLSCVVGRVSVIKQKFYRGDRKIVASEVLYSFYFVILIIVSVYNSEEPLIIISAAYEIRELLFVLIILYLLSDEGVHFSLKLYVELFTWCSVLGMLLIFLNYLEMVQPIFEVNLKYVQGYGESNRSFFGIGFIWPNTWIGSLYGLERLQSYADEAGTFGFAVLPAIFLAAYWHMNIRLSILISALFLTFSVGAIFIWLCFTFFVMPIVRKKNIIRSVIKFLLFVLALYLISNILPSSFFRYAESYFSSKYTYFGSVDTSVGHRIDGIKNIFDIIQDQPFGYGANSAGLSLDLISGSLAVGWLIPLVEAGVVGWLIYLLAFGLLLVHAARSVTNSSGLKQIIAVVILINGYAAFQRAGIDANIWHMYWLIVYLRVNRMNNSICNDYSVNRLKAHYS